MNTSYDGRLAASESLPTSPTITPEPLTVGATRTGGAREEILCFEAEQKRNRNFNKAQNSNKCQRMDLPVWDSSETSDEPESRAAEAFFF